MAVNNGNVSPKLYYNNLTSFIFNAKKLDKQIYFHALAVDAVQCTEYSTVSQLNKIPNNTVQNHQILPTI